MQLKDYPLHTKMDLHAVKDDNTAEEIVDLPPATMPAPMMVLEKATWN